MILPKRIQQKLDTHAVQRANEIYHNLEHAYYDARHDEILQFERAFWKNAAAKYLTRKDPIVCLDYGTGTGFVPETVGDSLKHDDLLICCDISSEMLRTCKSKLASRSLACQCSFRNVVGTAIPADTGSVDIITANSVLHHIFDLRCFSSECRRILKPGGLVIIAHEPNRSTMLSLPLRILSHLARVVFKPRTVLMSLVDKMPFLEQVARSVLSRTSKHYRQRNKMLAEVVRQLKEEKLIDFDLRGTELQQIVDFQAQYGFDRNVLLGEIFRGFETVEFETYCHLGFFAGSGCAASLDRYLRAHWPDAGTEMRFVLKLS
jgi:ubiquinone/menaquinone biosynthesis C-methylase UbiE